MTPSSPVKTKAQRRFNAYKESPDDIIEHFYREKESGAGYCKRPLLELLQNIEDALQDSSPSKPHALFLLNGDCLWVANKGNAFDVDGFEALCDSNRSPKYGENFIGNKGTGFKAILNWSETPEIHSGPIHARFNRKEAEELIKQHVGEERYSSRIGKNGWTGQAPLLRVPLEAEPDDTTKKLMDEGWATIIKFPLLDTKIQEVRETLEAFDPVNLLFLRYLKAVDIRINGKKISLKRTPGDETILTKQLHPEEPEITCYRLFRKDDLAIQPNDQKFGGICEIALAFRSDIPQKRHDDPYPMFNFFPIRNAPSPFFGLLLHATFILKSDRDELSEADETFHVQLANAIAELMAKVIPCMAEKHGHLCLHMLRKGELGATEQVKQIHHKLHNSLKDIPFIPDLSHTRRASKELKLWKWDLGNLLQNHEMNPEVDGKHLCDPEWQRDTKNNEVLQSLDSEWLDNPQHLEALQKLKPNNMEGALKALSIAANVLDKIDYRDREKCNALAKELMAWLVSDGTFRSLAYNVPLFEKRTRELPSEIPGWLQFDVLDPDFLSRLKEKSENTDSLWKCLKKHLSNGNANRWPKPSKPESFFENCLILSFQPHDQWWQSHGWEALRILLSLGLQSSSENIFDDQLRRKASEKCRVPVDDGGWRPAEKVYAGPSLYRQNEPPWGKFLAQQSENRYLLADKKSVLDTLNIQKNELEQYMNAFRYIGVSWLPKIVKKKFSYPQDVHSELCRGWKDYYNEELRDYLNERKNYYEKEDKKKIASWKVEEITWFEGLERLADAQASHLQILKLIKGLWAIYKPNKQFVAIQGEGPRGGYNAIDRSCAFPHWQLRSAKLFPIPAKAILCDEKLMRLDKMILEPGSGWKAWLPCIDLHSVKNDLERDQFKAFANEHLGALYRVEDVKAEQWPEWLTQLVGQMELGVEEDRVKHERTIRQFLDNMAKVLSEKNETSLDLHDSLRWPCRTASGIEFNKADEFYILDESRWEPLKDGLVLAGKSLLLVELIAGKRIAKLTNSEPRLLSNALRVERHTDIEGDADNTQKMKNLFHGRNHARLLALVVHNCDKDQASKLSHMPAIKAVKQLRVVPSIENKTLDEIHLPYFWFDGELWISTAENMWAHLAKGLCERYQLKHNLDDALDNLWTKLAQSSEMADAYLHEKGINDEAIAEWIEAEHDKPIMNRQMVLPEPQEQEMEVNDEPNEKPKDRKPRTTSNRRSRTIGVRSKRQGLGRSPDLEAGKKAEKFVFEKLQNVFQENGWDVLNVSGQHQEGQECDILLEKADQKILIEVKSIKDLHNAEIWLPVSETQTALLNEDRYWLVIIVGQEENRCAKYWIKDPLKVFEPFCRDGDFLWSGRITMRDIRPSQWHWKMPSDQPKRKPNNFSYRVVVTPEFLKKCSGFETFKLYVESL